jgi:hypothetical protein
VGKTDLLNTATAGGLSLVDIAQENVDELRKRYLDGFDQNRSIKRQV